MITAFLIGWSMVLNPLEPTTDQNADPIEMIGTGTARSYEATKRIFCGNVEWRVKWRSGPGRGKISGDVTAVVANKRKALPDAQAQIFAKFATLNSVSATCNLATGSSPTRSTLLASGYVPNGEEALAQLRVDSDLKPQWSFMIVDRGGKVEASQIAR